MRNALVFMLVCGAAAALSAQQASNTITPSEAQRMQVESALQAATAVGGRARAALETRTTTGAPYSAEAITEFTQVLGDGNRISRKSVTRVFRDGEGRTRREVTTTTAEGESVSISIVDPVAGKSFVLDPKARTATPANVVMYSPSTVVGGVFSGGGGGGRGGAVATATPSGSGGASGGGGGGRGRGGAIVPVEAQRAEAERAAAVEQATTSIAAASASKATQERIASGGGTTTTESLGQQIVEGVMAEGTRTTTVIPAGSVGNAQPITVLAEQWFSSDLQVLLMTRHSDPRTGETIYRLTNVVRGEPDRSLFEVPADYTIKSNVRMPVREPR